MVRTLTVGVLLHLATLAGPSNASAQGLWPGRLPAPDTSCRPDRSRKSAAEWLGRARDAVGLTRLNGRAIRFSATDISVLQNQSDRPYPPFLLQARASEWWFNPATGAEFTGTTTGSNHRGVLRTARATYSVRDTTRIPNPAFHPVFEADRPLNPLAVLTDWGAASDIVIEGTCVFRGYPRIVLESATIGGRLFVDPKSGFPVKFEREELQYLWGQVQATYLYQTWWQLGDAFLPVTATRMIDGVEEASRAVTLGGAVTTIGPDSAAWLAAPPGAPDMRNQPHPMLDQAAPDTVRVGAQSFLLVNRAYTNAVALARDTVFLFDSPIGEGRSRQDSSWVARLFRGTHPVVVVVTDLAWPHIAGVRFWVARGATIVTHRLSRPFLEQVIGRRWRKTPDALETVRNKVRPVFRVTDRRLDLAAGAIRLAPIDGVGSEGALMAYLPADGFLWAGDYIQDVRGPSLYTTEVWRATRREGIVPRRTAAQHLPLSDWSAVTAVADTTTRP